MTRYSFSGQISKLKFILFYFYETLTFLYIFIIYECKCMNAFLYKFKC